VKQALVLGAAGFIGRYAALALHDAGYIVTGIGHGGWSTQDQRAWGVERWHASDITIEALTTYAGMPSVLVQAAGSGSVAFSMTHPVQDYSRSVSTTLAALEFIRTEATDCKLILPSSAAVYGNVSTLPIGVTHPLIPLSPYGAHKVIAEDLCRSYGRSFGVRSAIIRLFSIYGVGLRKQLLWDAYHKLKAREPNFFGTGGECRDWLHVADAADLIVTAVQHASAEAPVVNGGTGISIANRDVLAWMAASLGGGCEIQFSGTHRGGDPVGHQADITEAAAWGWKPRRYLQSEISAIIDWIKGGAF
jgi:UDP-glucose 4-epimerase